MFIVQFDCKDGSQMFYGTLKGDFFGIRHTEHATRFETKKAAAKAADEIIASPLGSGFVSYAIIEKGE